jgi:hypothetical protein
MKQPCSSASFTRRCDAPEVVGPLVSNGGPTTWPWTVSIEYSEGSAAESGRGNYFTRSVLAFGRHSGHRNDRHLKFVVLHGRRPSITWHPNDALCVRASAATALDAVSL